MPKNFKYRALKEEIDKGSTFRSAYFFAKQFLNDADISEYNIKYYAMVAEEYNIGQLKKLKPTSAKLYLLCYIYYRYQQINDNLLICYNYYGDKFDKECKIHVMQKLIEHTKSYQANIPKVSNLLRFISNEQAESMEHKEFYNQAYRILEKQEYNPTADYLDGVSFNEKEVKWDYYLKISDRIKRYYRPMLRHLDLEYDKEKMAIVPGIKFLKKELSKSKVSFNKISNDNFPEGFIGKEERKYLKYKQDNEFIYEPNKYELYTYFAISRAINRGKVYCNESIRHKSLKSDLLSDERWKNKEELLKKLGYPNIAASATDILKELGNLLHKKILKVNRNIASGKNKYFKKDGDDWNLEYQTIGEEVNHKFFNKIQKKSIVDIMHFVNEKTKFCDSFTHIRTKHAKQQVEDNGIIACIIANGLGFGLYSMAQTSDINVHTLMNYEKNFLRVESLKKANDKIVNEIAKLDIYREWKLNLDKLLGGVDGQKHESKYQTIQSRHSPKYFGLKKGIVAFNFVVNNTAINS